MRAVIFLLLGLTLWPVGAAHGAAEVRDVDLRNCEFAPNYRAINVGDEVRWRYAEGSCTGSNHRIQTYGDSAVSFDSSPNCDDVTSSSSDCMNRSAPLQPRKETYTVTFTRQGSYMVRYYCPFHGSLSSSGTECSGMCGLIQVRGAQATATATASRTASASPTPRKTATPTATTSASARASASATPTSSVTPTATASATVLADDNEGGGGGGRAFIAVAAIAALAAAGFLVWRMFLAAR
jgi:plastocyanin